MDRVSAIKIYYYYYYKNTIVYTEARQQGTTDIQVRHKTRLFTN